MPNGTNGCLCNCAQALELEQFKHRTRMFTAVGVMLCIGVCLVGIAYQLLPDSSHQHLLKSLRVIGFVLTAFAITLSTRLRSRS